jgi:hypothetical protein
MVSKRKEGLRPSSFLGYESDFPKEEEVKGNA